MMAPIIQRDRPDVAQDGRTEPDLSPDTLFLEVSDFDDYVAFHRKCDMIARSSSTIPEKMSQKKCRFCD